MGTQSDENTVSSESETSVSDSLEVDRRRSQNASIASERLAALRAREASVNSEPESTSHSLEPSLSAREPREASKYVCGSKTKTRVKHCPTFKAHS